MKSIYVIVNENNNSFKIGCSKNPQKRIKQLQTGNSDVLTLFYERSTNYYSKIERLLHIDYQNYRLEGEWFDISCLSFLDIDDRISKYDKMFFNIKDNLYI